MIVLTAKKNNYIIYQRAHALLSSKLLYHLKTEYKSNIPNYFETIITTSAHDDGFTHTNGTYYLTDEGKPKDFRQMEFEREASEEILKNAKLKSIWCYVLALSHMENLHSYKKEDHIQSFITDIGIQKQRILKQEHISENALTSAYRFLKWADELSLQLCFHIKASCFDVKIPGFIQNNSCHIKIDGASCKISPYPCHTTPLALTIEYRQIPNQRYCDDQELYTALNAGPIHYKTFTFCE